MDAYEATKLVFSRIQALDPDHAAKIMGLLLIQDHGDKEMIRLAFGPDALLHAVMAKARTDLGLMLPPPTPPASSASTSPFLLSRQNCRAGTAPSPLSSSWAPPPVFSRTNGHANDEMPGAGEELACSPAPFFAAGDAALLDDLQLQFDGGWAGGTAGHRRSSSVSELCLGGGADGLGWKPCLYYARGYCKNGSACRFAHGGLGLPDDATAFPYSPTGSLPGSPSAATKCLSLLLQQQQQNASQRSAAAAALMLGGADDAHKFMARQARLDRLDLASVINPGSRQIYLTFPADSTFREEDVSNYFSIYGPVHDVRIPYQQKRMFGFVTFVYPETVKLILAKGNPHFICDARVLVKPYKEKGKVPDKCRKQQLQGDRVVDFSNGLDARDTFDLHQLGARMLQHSNSANEMLLRRKLEEQLQQAMELQGRRLMELQLLDLKSRSSSPTSHIAGMPFSPTRAVASPTGDSVSAAGKGGCSSFLLPLRRAVNGGGGGGDKEESAGEASPDADSDQSAEHNLPDSPFASPTKSSAAAAAFSLDPFAPTESEFHKATASSFAGINNGGGLISSHLRPSALDIPSPKAYFFPPMSRLSSDHGAGAIGM